MKLIIFDVDGTLIDSQDSIVSSMERAFETVGLKPPTRADSLSIVGLSLPSAMATLIGPQGPIDDMVAAYKSAFADLRARAAVASPFFAGIRELVENLATDKRAMLGIATGKSRRGVNHIFEAHDWGRLFATVQTADDAASKPDPAMIRRAMAETGSKPENVVMVGDTTYDMEMAARAGVRSIGVTWGYHPLTALRERGAQAIVNSSGELGASLRMFLEDGVLNR